MQCAPSVMWDPAETDGISEDWLDRLTALAQDNAIVQTPIGVMFTRADDVEQLLSHPSLKVPVVEQYQLLGVSDVILERARRVILGLDGAEHTRLRRLVNRAFTKRAVERLSDKMREHLKARLDSAQGSVDFLGDIVGGYPAAIIGGLLGLPDSDLPYLTSIAEVITSSQFSMDVERAHAYLAAAAECDEYLGALVRSKRQRPSDDILTQLTQVEIDQDSLSDNEIVALCASLMNAGIDTTRNQAALGMMLFGTFPAQWDRLRADPTLVANAVEEILRFLPVTPLLTRLNTAPVIVDGVEIPERTYISLGVAAANRDRALNGGDPKNFDVARINPRHFTFGHGAHFCLGAALARLELHELLFQLVVRFRSVQVIGPVPRRPVMGVYGVTSLKLQLQ
jgi:cytochrome P450